MYYVLSLSDYEEYVPYWFDCVCSKEEFNRIVRETISKVIDDIVKNHLPDDDEIDGNDILTRVIPLLEKEGFNLIKPDHEIFMHGSCHYHKGEEKPSPMTQETWDKILKYNKEMDDRFYARDFVKKIREQDSHD